MGTHGIVTVVVVDQVQMKFVAGCGGGKAAKLAAAIRAHWPLTATAAYDLARDNGFGCLECLAVVHREDGGQVKVYHRSGCWGDDSLYVSTFDDPRFDPRWAIGICEFTEVVEI
jgi:hypothetical protein